MSTKAPLTIQWHPNRSVTMPNLLAQNVSLNGMVTVPPSPSASNTRCASSTLSKLSAIETPWMPLYGAGRGVSGIEERTVRKFEPGVHDPVEMFWRAAIGKRGVPVGHDAELTAENLRVVAHRLGAGPVECEVGDRLQHMVAPCAGGRKVSPCRARLAGRACDRGGHLR